MQNFLENLQQVKKIRSKITTKVKNLKTVDSIVILHTS